MRIPATNSIVSNLRSSPEPSIRWIVEKHILRRRLTAKVEKEMRAEIARSKRVQDLLSERDGGGRISTCHPYSKWSGAHWVLVTLAELGYPEGDRTLMPLVDQVLECLLDESRLDGRNKRAFAPIHTIRDRPRAHASIDGNALYATLALGLADHRADELARRLIAWQWDDGGWNCDKNPHAHCSSFTESLIPLRALALHAKIRKSRASKNAAARAAEMFLERRLFRRKSNRRIIRPDFVKLHYPCYWHYDILFGLEVMKTAGFLSDPRCKDALDLLKKKRLPDGGFPAEAQYYRPRSATTGNSRVTWGGIARRASNPWVTAHALTVLE